MTDIEKLIKRDFSEGRTIAFIANRYWLTVTTIQDIIGMPVDDIQPIKKMREGTVECWSRNGKSVVIMCVSQLRADPGLVRSRLT